MSDPRIYLEPGRTYHIYSHASGSENLFRNDDNYRFFLWRYFQYIEPIADTVAYCLMPNHFHLLIQLRNDDEVKNHFLKSLVAMDSSSSLQGTATLEGLESKINLPKLISQRFSNLFNSYTQTYNKMFERKGNLFIPRFKRKLVDNEAYHAELVHYIHNNPVKHGFVSQPEDWIYSSWQQSQRQTPSNRLRISID